MNKEFFEKNKAILDEIKAKFPDRVKNLGDELGDPTLSPEIYPFVFLADRDPTGTESDIYQGYAGLILMWENTTSGDFFISPDNTASPFVWNKIASDSNLLTMLSNLGWKINTSRNPSASGISLNSSRQPSLTNDIEVIPTIKQVNTLLTSTALTAEISPNNSTWSTVGSIGVDNGAISSYTTMFKFTCPASYYYRLVASGTGTVTLTSCNELTM
jgi:hypothetical protein